MKRETENEKDKNKERVLRKDKGSRIEEIKCCSAEVLRCCSLSPAPGGRSSSQSITEEKKGLVSFGLPEKADKPKGPSHAVAEMHSSRSYPEGRIFYPIGVSPIG